MYTLTPLPKILARTTAQYNFNNSQFTWSPDSTKILVTTNSDQPKQLNIILSPDKLNQAANIKDVTAELPVILQEWQSLLDKKTHQQLTKLPEFMQQVATQSAHTYYFSPEEDKLMYLASQDLTIPKNLADPLPASSNQEESRDIQADQVYVYDIKEDKNFHLEQAQPTDNPDDTAEPELTPLDISKRYSAIYTLNTQWYPDSYHLITVTQGQDDSSQAKIIITEYDNTNQHTIYAGPFDSSFVFPWPNGSKLITLVSLNGGSDLPPNLYSINLK